MKVTQKGERIKLSAETDDDKRTLTNMLQKFVSKHEASTPEKIAAYYTDERDAVKFIGFPMYVVCSNLGTRHCQNDAIAREFIAEILEQKGFYGYYVYHSPERIERVGFWLPPPPPPVLAQK